GQTPTLFARHPRTFTDIRGLFALWPHNDRPRPRGFLKPIPAPRRPEAPAALQGRRSLVRARHRPFTRERSLVRNQPRPSPNPGNRRRKTDHRATDSIFLSSPAAPRP